MSECVCLCSWVDVPLLSLGSPVFRQRDPRANPRCMFKGDQIDLPCPDNRFQGILAVGSMKHVIDLQVKDIDNVYSHLW